MLQSKVEGAKEARNSQHIEGMEVDEVQWGEVKVLRCL